MTKLIAAIVLTAAAGVAAQTPPPGPANPGPPPGGSTVTATGCIRAGAEPGGYTLANITWDGDAAAKDGKAGQHHPASPEGGAPAPSSARPQTMRLAGAIERLKVSDHVGHTVTVTGMIASEDPIVTPAVVLPEPPIGDTTSREAAAKDAARRQVLNVRSLTMVKAACQ